MKTLGALLVGMMLGAVAGLFLTVMILVLIQLLF